MKRKFATRVISWLMLCCIAFAFTGCDTLYSFIPELCPHNVDGYWDKNADGHWFICSTCGNEGQSEVHTFVDQNGEKTCSVCNYVKIEAKGSISFHFMMLGNNKAGDCVYVKAGENDILIDAGSRENSIDDIKNYIDQYVTDGTLEYVIVTHGDQDHIAGFSKEDGSIFDLYECGIIIDFPKTTKNTQTYNRYLSERNAEVALGAKHYTALECYNNQNGGQRVYELTDDGSVKMEVLYNYFYENTTKDENDYSVCVQFTHGDRKFLFTGDLEKEGEEYLVEYNDLSEVELFKAGHHGSPTSSNDCLLNVIKPKICVVCCCAGSVEYTSNLSNTFPSQAFVDRIAPFTKFVYAPITTDVVLKDDKGTADTSDDEYSNASEYKIMNGDIVVVSNEKNGVSVSCSHSDTVLKDTEWFKAYRKTPSAWLN